MSKTVLIISPFFTPNIGGVETHLDDLCFMLSEQHIHAYVITYQPLTTKAIGERLERRRTVTIFRQKWYGYNLFHKLEKYPLIEFLYLFPGIFLKSLFFTLKHKNEIGVVHSHGLVASFAAKILKSIFKIKIIASTHAIYGFKKDSLISKFVKYIFASFDKILTLSTPSKEELINIGVDASRVEDYRYWIDQEVFNPFSADERKKYREKLGWQNKFVVLFVGRLLEIKGVKLLLDAANLLKENVYIAIIGDGPLAGEVKNSANSNSKIIFKGKIDNNKLNLYYNSADVVIVPSLYEEGYGRVILESLSCGTPVIASNKGGIKEVVNPNVGVLIEPTAENIADSVNKLYNDNGEMNKLRSYAREYTLERFSSKNAEVIISNYGIK